MRARIVVLLIAGLLLAPGLSAAQSATPAASPIAIDPCASSWHWCAQAGYVDRTASYFLPSAGSVSYGLGEMLLGAAVFDSTEHARSALPAVISVFAKSFSTDMSQVFPASVRAIADRSLAYAGPAVNKNNDGSIWKGNFAAIAVLSGNVIWYGYSDGAGGTDALTEFAPIMQKMVEGKPRASADIHVLTPSIDDVPEGWRLIDSSVVSR